MKSTEVIHHRPKLSGVRVRVQDEATQKRGLVAMVECTTTARIDIGWMFVRREANGDLVVDAPTERGGEGVSCACVRLASPAAREAIVAETLDLVKGAIERGPGAYRVVTRRRRAAPIDSPAAPRRRRSK